MATRHRMCYKLMTNEKKMRHKFLLVDKTSYPQAVWKFSGRPVDKLENLWRKPLFPEKPWKFSVDKPGDKRGGQVDNLGITRGKPAHRFVTNIAEA